MGVDKDLRWNTQFKACLFSKPDDYEAVMEDPTKSINVDDSIRRVVDAIRLQTKELLEVRRLYEELRAVMGELLESDRSENRGRGKRRLAYDNYKLSGN